MKTDRRPLLAHLFLSAVAFAAFSTVGRAQADKPAPPAPAPAEPAPAPTYPPAAPPVPVAPEFPSAQWIDIREYSYDQRAIFFSGFKAVEARVDAQIAELNAKRAAMNPATDTRDWDLAMQEMITARTELKSTGDDLRKAKPQAWNDQKEKVGVAWVHTQDAFAKVKLSTTN